MNIPKTPPSSWNCQFRCVGCLLPRVRRYAYADPTTEINEIHAPPRDQPRRLSALNDEPLVLHGSRSNLVVLNAIMVSWHHGSIGLKGKTLSTLIRLACGIAFILFGYEQGVMGGVITGSAFTAQFPSIDTTTASGNAQLQGAVLGMYNIGSFFGSLLTALIGENLGRKTSIVLGCLIIAFGTLLQCTSFALGQLIVSSPETLPLHRAD